MYFSCYTGFHRFFKNCTRFCTTSHFFCGYERHVSSPSSTIHILHRHLVSVYAFPHFHPLSDPPHKPTDDTTADEFRDLLNLNLISYFLASKYALPHLRQRQGNIINLSSLVGSIGQKNAAPYVATKGAIIAMTKAMAVDESRYQVRVNCISPGNVMTPLWEELAGQTADTLATIKEGENAQATAWSNGDRS
ncbi:unnamed protein product [Oncorhynchus mykiss]|uniref:17-beta-hydroxysteroid dehydrogenase 14 n=1 Tax=Oncorhynchus mykiss TaxID=8022 RepID=A0A060ZDP9_ONCMY|nr:unnamed protein product [Oncorhynchus mykiss]